MDRGYPALATWGPPPQRRRAGCLGGGCLGLLLTLVGGVCLLGFALSLLGSLVVPGPGLAPAGPRLPREAGPAPEPAAPGSAEAVLQANRLYRAGALPEVECPAPALGNATEAEQNAFYRQLMGCLDAAWDPAMDRARLPDDDPGLVVFDSSITTPCGTFAPQTGRVLAFYCLANSVMYADAEQMADAFGAQDLAYALVVGHEYGHHVQLVSGMAEAEYEVVQTDPSLRLDLSRRRELQASCFGGLFMGAVAETYPVDEQRRRELVAVSRTFGDAPGAPAHRRTHGTGESNSFWILEGFTEPATGRCNTFTAVSGLVQ